LYHRSCLKASERIVNVQGGIYLGIGALRLSFIIVLFYQKAKHSIKLYGNQRDEELDDEETDVNSVAI
jgi:hypothetical protein